MTAGNNEVINDNPQRLLDELRALLEKQVALARRGSIGEVEVLSRQADSIVEKIIQTKTPDSPQSLLNAKHREQLGKLYENLCLAISAQKTGAGAELKNVRKSKKTIQTYRRNISMRVNGL